MSLNRVLRCLGGVAEEPYFDGVEAVLRANPLCTLATACPDGRPYVSVAFYAWTDDLELILMSSPTSTHGTNIEHDSRVAVSICDSAQRMRDQLVGLQLTGTMSQADGLRAVRTTAQFGRRFHSELQGMRGQSLGAVANLRPYLVVPNEVKLTDHRRLGPAVAVATRPGHLEAPDEPPATTGAGRSRPASVTNR
jgi:uncharacterized protein YhbP (UPF0306 family)